MKKTTRFLAITAMAFALGLSVNNFASAKSATNFNVGVVDIQKVVANSPQMSALKTEQKNKITELNAFVENAKADVAKQTDVKKKKALEDGYNKELNARKDALDKEAVQKLSEIDKNIKDAIKAKSADYDLVLLKSSVLEGGVDITNEVIKELK